MGKFRALFVNWLITDHCNMKCSKCDHSSGMLGNASEVVVDRVVDECRVHEVWRVNLTGGEPLLHPDLERIIYRLNEAGVHVSVSSNGYLVPDCINALAGASSLILSLDGGPETHDATRVPGSFETVVAALGALREYGIPAKITSAINARTTREDIDDVINAASAFQTPVSFQPSLLSIRDPDHASAHSPNLDRYRAAMQRIMDHKNKTPQLILNTTKGLRHLMRWPEATAITCGAGRFFCQIGPAGDLFACGNNSETEMPVGNILEHGLIEPFANRPPKTCSQCWCGDRVEANLIFGLNPHALLNYFRNNNGYD